MYTLICFILILSLSVANVSVRDCTSCGDENDYFRNVHATEITRSIFTFGYHQGDILAMRIYIKNIALNVITNVYFTNNYFSGEKQEKELQEPNVGNYIRIRRRLSMRNFVIDVVLSTEKGVCFKKRIVEARDVSFLSAEINRNEYNDICLRSHWCEIEVNLENICRDLSVGHETNKPRIRTPKSWRPSSYLETFYRHRSVFPTYSRGTTSPRKGKDTITTCKTIANNHDPSNSYDTNSENKQTTTERPARDINSCKINTFAPNVSTSYAVTPTSPQENSETTTNNITTSETYAQTFTSSTNYALIIYSSIAAVAMILMILLVVYAIRTRCCVTHRPHGTPQQSTNENLYQMPQNLPLQKETEYEYESVYNEEHIYEEINYMAISK